MSPINSPHVLDEIIHVLKEGATFCLSGHENPDADVIGSQLAMASLIQRLGAEKRVDIKNSGDAPESLDFFPGIEKIENVQKIDGRYDVLIVFECSGKDRMGNIIDFDTQANKVINLDHHLGNPHFGDVNYVESETSSTSELVFKIFKHAGYSLNKDEALYLYTGIVADTGCFRYGNTTEHTHNIAGELLHCGAPVADVSERIYMGKSDKHVTLLANALGRMDRICDNRVAVMEIPNPLYEEIRATPDDTDEIVNYGLLTKTAVVSVLFKEKMNPSEVKVSFRSKGAFDVNRIARFFHGGGHKNASGCTMKGDMYTVRSAVLKEIKSLF